jgi:hypothetical protein
MSVPTPVLLSILCFKKRSIFDLRSGDVGTLKNYPGKSWNTKDRYVSTTDKVYVHLFFLRSGGIFWAYSNN